MGVNVAMALLLAFKVAARETSSAPGDVTNLAVGRLLQDRLCGFVVGLD